MSNAFPTIEFPELVFGFVAAIGVDLQPVLRAYRGFLEAQDYQVFEIKVTNSFEQTARYISPKKKLKSAPLKERYITHIAYGNQLRAHFEDDAILAATSILQVMQRRHSAFKRRPSEPISKAAYLIHQFKRKEEVDLLRSVYGRIFFQVSIYSRRGARVDYLSRRIADSHNSADSDKFRSDAEYLIEMDENEVAVRHGQRVAAIFHDADFIINSDSVAPTVGSQIVRFCELLFGSNSISPTKSEYGMFLAKAAALRTLDLSRQVGAAIFSESGEVICLGSNEVPKALGGTYWSDDEYDDREFRRGHDSNDVRKRELLAELLQAYDRSVDLEKAMKQPAIANSQLMDALEYGRIVHAEMSAVSDAARNGRSVRGAILYSTTFPCHMCAKHIVSSGIAKVVFLEPYPKSLAADLHSDSIEIEGSDRGPYSKFPKVVFEHYYGVTPRRYRELFERGKRKSSKGEFLPYRGGKKRPCIDLKAPFYLTLEERVIEVAARELKQLIGN